MSDLTETKVENATEIIVENLKSHIISLADEATQDSCDISNLNCSNSYRAFMFLYSANACEEEYVLAPEGAEVERILDCFSSKIPAAMVIPSDMVPENAATLEVINNSCSYRILDPAAAQALEELFEEGLI